MKKPKTVEEARADVIEAGHRILAMADTYYAGDLAAAELNPVMDALIRAARAAMPCYHSYCGDDCDHYGVACPGYSDGLGKIPDDLCPSCKAREDG